MDLRTYFWDHLDLEQRQAFATAAGYKFDYLRAHLIPQGVRPRKNPTKHGIYQLADASNGHVTRAEAVQYFFPSGELRVSPRDTLETETHLPDG